MPCGFLSICYFLMLYLGTLKDIMNMKFIYFFYLSFISFKKKIDHTNNLSKHVYALLKVQAKSDDILWGAFHLSFDLLTLSKFADVIFFNHKTNIIYNSCIYSLFYSYFKHKSTTKEACKHRNDEFLLALNRLMPVDEFEA